MRLEQLTFIGFYLNSSLDTGNYGDISIGEVKDHIDAGDIFDFLKERLGRDIDLGILSDDDKSELIDHWQNLVNAVDEGRKMGVRNGGLNLLLGYVLEGIQSLKEDGSLR